MNGSAYRTPTIVFIQSQNTRKRHEFVIHFSKFRLQFISAMIRILYGGEVDNHSEVVLGGRYKILGHIGSGGMANVFRARDLNLQRDVAIKILHDDLIEDPSFQARFLQEARAAANLIHPNIVTIYDFGHDEQRYYIVMEYVDGKDLKSVIRESEHMEITRALDLMIQICEGVGYAHRAGLVHCDLKPQNILVSPDGRAKITDFGISLALAAINPEEHTDVVWGSPKYFAPEQAAGTIPSPSSDVYALGIILYEMLTGKLPFEADSAEQLARLHQTMPPPSPRTYNEEISPRLESVLLKVLSKEPAARYRTADQLGRVLQSIKDMDGKATLQEVNSIPEQPSYPFQSQNSGRLSFVALGGLIPLWLWVCLHYPSCPF
jgi:serine/threonine protein kinase